jgi:hypothetical protein
VKYPLNLFSGNIIARTRHPIENSQETGFADMTARMRLCGKDSLES